MRRRGQLDAAGESDPGLKLSANQDRYKILIPPAGTQQARRGALFMVADGMGGIGGGEIASQAAVDEIIRHYYGGEPSEFGTSAERLSATLDAANTYVRAQAAKAGLQYIGTTVAGLLLASPTEGIVFNVGDSRVYRAQGTSLELLSQDQSVLAQQIQHGLVSPEEKRQSNSITAFLGQPLPLKPAFRAVAVQQSDIFVICSDGLWDQVSSREITEIVRKNEARRAAQKLIALARQRGAPDNVTAIVIKITTGVRRQFLVAFATLLLVLLMLLSYLLIDKNSASTPSETNLTGAPLRTEEQPDVFEAISTVAPNNP